MTYGFLEAEAIFIMFSLAKFINLSHKEKYKIVIWQADLNQLLKENLLTKESEIKKININIAKDKLTIKGVVNNPKKVKNRKKKKLSFVAILKKTSFSSHEVFFLVEDFKIYYPLIKIDFLKILNQYSNVVKERVVTLLTEGDSPFRVVEKYDQISFDLDYLLHQIPSEVSLLGKIGIDDVHFEKNHIVGFISSNFMLKALIHIFGTQFLSVEQINERIDPISLLSNVFLKPPK